MQTIFPTFLDNYTPKVKKVLEVFSKYLLGGTTGVHIKRQVSRFLNGSWKTLDENSIVPLSALALHLVSFGSNTINYSHDVNAPKLFFETGPKKITNPVSTILQPLAIIIDLLRVLKNNQSEPGHSTLDLLDLHNGLSILEEFQIDNLKKLDKSFVNYLPTMLRCITWLVEIQDTKEVVIAPFLTCIPDNNFHVMYYTIFPSNNNRILKVVVDNYLVEIPFEVRVPPHLDALSIVIIGIPTFDDQKVVTGVKIMVYEDSKFHLVNETYVAPNLQTTNSIVFNQTNTTTYDQTVPIVPSSSEVHGSNIYMREKNKEEFM